MDYSFGNWVKRRRKAIDLTQQELAQRVGCSPATIVKIESDERRPSRQMAELLAQFLEIPAEQHEQFLKIARKEKSSEALGEIEIPGTGTDPPLPRPKTQFLRSPEPLIGREFELAEITRFIKDPKCRLLTLTGAGGIGKTRLTLEAAAQLQTDFEYGAIFIPLAPLSGRDQIVTAIADALGFVLYSASDRSVQLIAHLRNKEVLLVLDNFEHLLNQKECTSLPGDFLQGAPSVKLLVTSREPLQLQAEWVLEVRGLPVPAIDDPDLVGTSSAMKLFIQRAQQTRAGFAPTPADRAAIRQICQLVDGMPLAIEIAAAWTRTLSCSEIAHEIQANINFLTTSARDVTERHRSIRATLDYSWKLLSSDEQTVLRRLSVFKGGFTREAAEAVAGAGLSALSALVAKSLLHRIESGRYDLHELVRQFALDYLRKDEAEYLETQDRHSEYYSQLLQRRGDEFKSMDQPRVGAELAAEIANLRQAWRWAGERGQALQVGQAADTLFWLYESRCDCREGVPLFGYVAKSLEVGSPPARGAIPDPDQIRDIARARVMAYQGFFCLRQGRHPQSRELLQKSLEILRPLAQGGSSTGQEALPYTLAFLGMVTAALGDYAGGSRHLYEGLEMKRASNDLWGVAFCLRQLGLLAYYQGAYDDAHRLLRESLDVSRAIGNSWAVAYSLDFLGTAAYAQGAYAEAERFLHEGLTLSQAVGDRFTTAYALNGLGLVKKALGEYAEGQQQLEDSITIWREIGDQASLAQSLNNLGDILLKMSNRTEAEKCFREALAVARNAGLVPIMLDALLGSASLRAAEGSKETALRALAHIKNHPAGIETTKKRAETLYSQLQSELPIIESGAGTQTFHEEVFHQLVDEALGQ